MALLNERKWIRQGDWTGKEIEALNSVKFYLFNKFIFKLLWLKYIFN
jgi:hypothetical protein